MPTQLLQAGGSWCAHDSDRAGCRCSRCCASNAQQQHRQFAGQTQHQQQQVPAGLAADATVVTDALAAITETQDTASAAKQEKKGAQTTRLPRKVQALDPSTAG